MKTLRSTLRVAAVLGGLLVNGATVLAEDFPHACQSESPGAPTWIKAGTRITYVTSAPSFVQVNVAALDRETVALDIRSYTVDASSGAVLIPDCSGWVGAAENGNEYWIHPTALAATPEQESVELTVQKIAYELDGRAYNALRIHTQNPTGPKVRIYDLASGVLLHAQPGNSSNGSLTLVSIRTVNLPWNGMAAPAWVGQTQALGYAGQHSVAMPGNPTIFSPVTADFKFLRSGAGWVQFSEQAEVKSGAGAPAQQSQKERVVGTHGTGGLWVPPAVLAQLVPGELDADPVTKTRFAFDGITRRGASFTEASEGSSIRYIYSPQTGMLVDQTTTLQVGAATSQRHASLQTHL